MIEDAPTIGAFFCFLPLSLLKRFGKEKPVLNKLSTCVSLLPDLVLLKVP
ncbi:hypothetical protein BWGOE3_08080 [Bacillus mycoides]|uniref:Uncharacterized protein n=1 Tax=Bacillus mycoides TaxID=1405 RepID=A0A1E8BT89_BACMY|nr:hypothetical protein BWGOE2_08140 [Bacillus mycoides]OFD50108.1 hypothetical protein BWGOE1_08400 [Bacillus mycoides]OFD52088.1 hypothetical protein BWGOE3_08080 [Bacillus mycoides]OFD65074.1 hypothetical protein BWGOE6_08460 [Bacillus mycoides]OFE00208.1 hypothetical protein BWGOE11_09020 [Bacillus mycoides]